MKEWNVGDRVTRQLSLDDGTWNQLGDSCLADSPVRHGAVSDKEWDARDGRFVYQVAWDDGKVGRGYLVGGLDAEGIDTITPKLERFLADFPDDATCWSKATAELPDMYTWISVDGTRLPPVGRDNCRTPAEWNQKYKAAIRTGYAQLSQTEKEKFAERFREWLG